MTFQAPGTPLTPLPELFSRRSMGPARGQRSGIVRVIALTALKPYQGGEGAPGALAFDHFDTSANTVWNASVSHFVHPNSGIAGAALPGAARDQYCRDSVAPQPDQSRLDRACPAGHGGPDLHRRIALARNLTAMPGAAHRFAGVPLQHDRRVLQSDTALLDRRRRGAALARPPHRRRVASGDLFDIDRSGDRADRFGSDHRCQPAVELRHDRRL